MKFFFLHFLSDIFFLLIHFLVTGMKVLKICLCIDIYIFHFFFLWLGLLASIFKVKYQIFNIVLAIFLHENFWGSIFNGMWQKIVYSYSKFSSKVFFFFFFLHERKHFFSAFATVFFSIIGHFCNFFFVHRILYGASSHIHKKYVDTYIW